MSIERFIPEVWSARLLQSLRAALVYAGPTVVNRDYEGEVRNAGDTVRITSISRPTIGDYIPNVTQISPENLSDSQRTIVVDQAKYYAFEVDDVDARQALGNVMTTGMDEAAYAMGDIMDRHVSSHYTQAAPANAITMAGDPVQLAAKGELNAGGDARVSFTLYEVLVAAGVRLDRQNVPSNGRWVVVPPWARGTMQLDDRFSFVDHAGQSETLYNGTIARAAGFNIMLSNNAPSPEAGASVLLFGRPGAISHIEQLNKTEAYRPESAFSDAVKGLALYGSKVLLPEGLGYALVTEPETDMDGTFLF